jgi:hypothetical protein
VLINHVPAPKLPLTYILLLLTDVMARIIRSAFEPREEKRGGDKRGILPLAFIPAFLKSRDTIFDQVIFCDPNLVFISFCAFVHAIFGYELEHTVKPMGQ